MTDTTTCPECGAEVTGGAAIPGNEPSTGLAPERCERCGAALTPAPQPRTMPDGGWHTDDAPQA